MLLTNNSLAFIVTHLHPKMRNVDDDDDGDGDDDYKSDNVVFDDHHWMEYMESIKFH